MMSGGDAAEQVVRLSQEYCNTACSCAERGTQNKR